MRHDLKTWPTYFAGLVTGQKTFEVRRDDREFKIGDELRLREWDEITGQYTGREETRQVTYVLRDFPGVADGWCVMGLSDGPF